MECSAPIKFINSETKSSLILKKIPLIKPLQHFIKMYLGKILHLNIRKQLLSIFLSNNPMHQRVFAPCRSCCGCKNYYIFFTLSTSRTYIRNFTFFYSFINKQQQIFSFELIHNFIVHIN
jgi:hypothetical protein